MPQCKRVLRSVHHCALLGEFDACGLGIDGLAIVRSSSHHDDDDQFGLRLCLLDDGIGELGLIKILVFQIYEASSPANQAEVASPNIVPSDVEIVRSHRHCA